ncbi:50S ribosomal protein L23 [Candidatus Daviesbacteria bacterium]|nr:50S ribosomal protein L23 [Candidatus Daviesbacteria bacterium]
MKIILQKAHISEKTMGLAKAGWYTFLVSRNARKPEIIKAVNNKFEVEVIAIKTANYKKETKLQRSRKGHFTVPGFKKAIVALKNGQKIALFETETVEEKQPEKKEAKEKKSLLKGTKVKIEKSEKKEVDVKDKKAKSKKKEKK